MTEKQELANKLLQTPEGHAPRFSNFKCELCGGRIHAGHKWRTSARAFAHESCVRMFSAAETAKAPGVLPDALSKG